MYVHRRVAFYKTIIDGEMKYLYVPIDAVDELKDFMYLDDLKQYLVDSK